MRFTAYRRLTYEQANGTLCNASATNTVVIRHGASVTQCSDAEVSSGCSAVAIVIRISRWTTCGASICRRRRGTVKLTSSQTRYRPVRSRMPMTVASTYLVALSGREQRPCAPIRCTACRSAKYCRIRPWNLTADRIQPCRDLIRSRRSELACIATRA
jgi:hypothetical protein